MNYISGLGSVTQILLIPPLLDDYKIQIEPMGQLLKFPSTKTSGYIFSYGRRKIQASFFFANRQDYKNFVDFYKTQFGEFKKFWVPIWINEFELNQTVYSDSVVLPIKRCGFAERYDGTIRVFMIVNNDIIVRKVIEADVISETVETMVINAGVPYTIKPEDVKLFGRVILVRFEGDLQWSISKADGEELYASATINLIELPYEYEEV